MLWYRLVRPMIRQSAVTASSELSRVGKADVKVRVHSQLYEHVILSHVLAALNFARASRCYPKLSKSRRARLSLWSGEKKSNLTVAFRDFILGREATLC